MTDPATHATFSPPATTLSVAQVEELAFGALTAAGASLAAARSLALAVAAAEADGIASHGLLYLPTYCEHLRCGKVDGAAVPQVRRAKPALLVVDACTGFAHPAIDKGFEALLPLAGEFGLAAMAVRNSYNCGVLGYHTERAARAGYLCLGFTNAPASIAPVGGRRAVLGTNPVALAVPDGHGGVAISIDQSASIVAKSEIMKRARDGRSIPEGWAFGPDGAATTDPAAALRGSMAPSGGYKGVGIALLVEVLAAASAGASLGTEASPFSGPAGGPPRTGQFFIAIDAGASSSGLFDGKIATLVDSIVAQDGTHLPGSGRAKARRQAEANGIRVETALIDRIRADPA